MSPFRTATLAALAPVLALTVAACNTQDGTDPSPADGDGTAGDATSFEWSDTGHDPVEQAIHGPEWSAIVDENKARVTLTDGDTERTVAAPTRRRIDQVLLDDQWAVVVMQDAREDQPATGIVVDLATGEQRDVVTPQPATGGSWAMQGGNLYYPSLGEGRGWCLATLALADHNGEDGWCAGHKQGWSNPTVTEHGVSVMTFDNRRPVACRTVNLIDATGRPEPVEGPTDCRAWDVVAVEGGVVWSEVPKPRRQEEATFHARVGEERIDLGPGMTGSLTPCGDSVFWTLDPQSEDDPARLMRWRPGSEPEAAYETEATGNAFLGQPQCAAGHLTIASFSEDGDEQVWAQVPVD